MPLNFEGLFGNVFKQSVRLRDTHHAVENFGLNKPSLNNGTPRHKFEFFVRINFDEDVVVRNFVKAFLSDTDQNMISTMVKSVTMPSMAMDTDTITQYNKKRISQKRITYSPITITFHDSVEGRTLRLWEMYYEYYFKDGLAQQKTEKRGEDGGRRLKPAQFENDIITDKFTNNFGYNLERVGNRKYLINSIDIYQVHGGLFSRTTIINPRISQFTHDTLDYEDTNGLVQMQMEFAYEDVIYTNTNTPLSEDELERYRRGDFWEMAHLVSYRTPVPGRNLDGPDPTSPNTACDATSSLPSGQDDSQLSHALGTNVGQQGKNRNLSLVEGAIGNIVGTIPNAIGAVASASIFGGTVSLLPDPKQALRTVGNQIVRNVVGDAQRGFQSAVTDAATDVISGIQTSEEGTEGEGGG